MYTTAQIISLINTGKTATFYNNRTWRRKAKEVLLKQNNECQVCKSKGKYNKAVIVHHVNHLKRYPELAYNEHYIDEQGNKHRQLIALCFCCHENEHPERFPKKIGFTNNEKW